jgi:cation transport protein ChaC
LLTRENIFSGDYVRTHEKLFPADMLWDIEKIHSSMSSVLLDRVPGEPVWIFAYGSLMWNPLIVIEEMHRAELQGWQRRFCIRLTSGRATPECPGRMLSLDAGGKTQGMVFRLPDAGMEKELMLIWTREMITGLYNPVWASARLSTGKTLQVLAFVSDINHPFYESDSSTAAVIKSTAVAKGYMGTNAEYITQLDSTLASWGMKDDYVADIAGKLRITA